MQTVVVSLNYSLRPGLFGVVRFRIRHFVDRAEKREGLGTKSLVLHEVFNEHGEHEGRHLRNMQQSSFEIQMSVVSTEIVSTVRISEREERFLIFAFFS